MNDKSVVEPDRASECQCIQVFSGVVAVDTIISIYSHKCAELKMRQLLSISIDGPNVN